MAKKIPGKLNEPPPETEFNQLEIAKFCKPKSGILYRLHSTDLSTGKPWEPVFFSKRGATRFDPTDGVGTLYVAKSLAGAVLEIFDDRWGPVGSIERTFTKSELETWWVTLIDLPTSSMFETMGINLSKIGTDTQLLSGDHATAREWALRLMNHPDRIGGISYASRHDHTKDNLAVFLRAGLMPQIYDANLASNNVSGWQREAHHGTVIVNGPAIRLGTHPELKMVVMELEVGIP